MNVKIIGHVEIWPCWLVQMATISLVMRMLVNLTVKI